MEKTSGQKLAERSRKEEAQSNILKVVKIERRRRDARTMGERISEVIAMFSGSMTFVYIHILWFGGWIALNTLAPVKHFDPYPFTFLTLIVSLEAIFLSTFILISQNHETEMTDRRNQLDLQINMLAEQENTKIIELLEAVAEKVGVDLDKKAMENLLEPIDPEELADQIDDLGKN